MELYTQDESLLHNLRHYLPAQSPLKDFIHHNTLHAFQSMDFHAAMQKASTIFGYRTYLPLAEYRSMFQEGKISKAIIERIIDQQTSRLEISVSLEDLLTKAIDTSITGRIGSIRNKWKQKYKINLSKETHPTLLRIISSYVDQGIAIHGFPQCDEDFISSLALLDRSSYLSIFKTARPKAILQKHQAYSIRRLLHILVGDESLYEQYLFDQQFEHPGWSGMVNVIENNPEALVSRRSVTLCEFVFFELLLEIDALDAKFGETWAPLAHKIRIKPASLFFPPEVSPLITYLAMWHEAFEWTYYEDKLLSIKNNVAPRHRAGDSKTFQGIFCIDDRECSFRRHLEYLDPGCATFSTAGFFNVEFFFLPYDAKIHTKLCPASLTPKHLIKEQSSARLGKKLSFHFSRQTHGLFGGSFSALLGYGSAWKLLRQVFRPTLSGESKHSFHHMNPDSVLTIEFSAKDQDGGNLQVGFTQMEMCERIETLLKGIGLIRNFAPLVYIVGHGASSVNNPYYAGYDCGACAGRPGSVNARVAAHMANLPSVRRLLASKGIVIPATTQFVGGLQDTTRDEIEFYDLSKLSDENMALHKSNCYLFNKALQLNATERAKKFGTLEQHSDFEKTHGKVKERAVSLFEPRPEYNHATNALCIIGRRSLSHRVFLDRRAFLNSYDHSLDPEGKYLLGILKAVIPVCGGINLEYYFSRVDNEKLGAGSKLPHNVVGLIGVANGAEGDLRTGLPQQMIEIHDPMRLLLIIEQMPEIILNLLRENSDLDEWLRNSWIHLVAMDPKTRQIFRYQRGTFLEYQFVTTTPGTSVEKYEVKSA